ncbi:FdrA family protein [Streptomonospora litoralis]|uniref:Succinyl-CoA ligase [ADP-forming] subunit alpha n=1 Tax=Streptomonospora litoralis TaxID=2498135 RepID=A0A4P6Q5P6_9ACTN|nr:FdrA family protein [Streptomonospora litoralis]QBI55610.1 Succinyl-CoA ligase [ADP-forming] subunit alpha [Streptomonospora litoralis]
MTTEPVTATRVEVRKGAYRDSVALMRVTREVAAVEGVEAALVAMATELNLGILADMGGTAPDGTGPDDLVIAVRAPEEAAASAALATAEAELAAMSAGGHGAAPADAPPRTLRTAARSAEAEGRPATLALVSVPGRYAAAEAFDALEAGLDVLVFSDNVPVEHEVALKRRAEELDRLVMGPDCGTAMVGGAGFGFANAVRPGPVGVVAASGTGAQQVMCLLDAAGAGVSHCLGVGGRDLSEAVGGVSTRRALRMLDEDPATERIVLVSKPPAPRVAEEVRREAERLSTPVHTVLVGTGDSDIAAAVAEVASALGRDEPQWPRWLPKSPSPRRTGALRGLFCGGTLAGEAAAVATRTLGPVASNTGADPVVADTPGHLVIDFGDDAFTLDRPHPMIDPAARADRFAAELADPATGAVLADVVLGHGAHPDPAAGLAEALEAAEADRPHVVISLCGALGDAQGLADQAERLRRAGAEVYAANSAAARRAADLAAGGDPA